MIINTVYNEDGEFVREEPFDTDVELDKLYPPEQTNEEWFCGLSTEEKAEWLYRVHYGGIGIGLTKEEIRKWLKEVHKE